MKDTLTRFMFDHLPIRGELVHLDQSWQDVLARRNYPVPVRDLLGQASAAAALLADIVKIDGKLTLQIQSTGSVYLLVVQVGANGSLRALARFRDDIDQQHNYHLKELCGDGNILISIENKNNAEPYQGQVALHGSSLSQAIESYFNQSEQLPTCLKLAASATRVGGCLLQKMPNPIADDFATLLDEDAWPRLTHLMKTLTDDELTTLDTPRLLHRLYHEENIRLFEPSSLYFECGCSRERSLALLSTFESAEIQTILDTDKVITVDCEFCGYQYIFTETDIQES